MCLLRIFMGVCEKMMFFFLMAKSYILQCTNGDTCSKWLVLVLFVPFTTTPKETDYVMSIQILVLVFFRILALPPPLPLPLPPNIQQKSHSCVFGIYHGRWRLAQFRY